MTAETISLYVKVPPDSFTADQETENVLLGLGPLCLKGCMDNPTCVQLGTPGNKLYTFVNEEGSHASMRIYSHGLVTFDIQYLIQDGTSPYNMDYIRNLQSKIKQYLGTLTTEVNSLYTPIKRGGPVWPYTVAGDERLIEADYDAVVSNVDSRWQNILIMHSKEHGNVLRLDHDTMYGESDKIYIDTLCQLGRLDFKNKEILILGGGDGGIIHELQKENPKMITMAEIDEEVIKVCRKHLRSVCGDTMDTFIGPNYKILIKDCVDVLKQAIESGKKYDFVINDLTEFPVDKESKGFDYDFETASQVLEMSLQTIKDSGKYLARGNTKSAVEYREGFERDVRKLGATFTRRDVHVPSFYEVYSLYEIWKLSTT
ncbi:unnamed protein product [Owenia fusiformis]|uniref:Uncharacterized protein n=1 Tax=Owenia fusiformis TaxID=6347 RepID=A0A8J1Y4T9_OWEFU|nr:unnamed protein product [Owenia fusiformis]